MNQTSGTSILDRYLANLSVEVEPFAVCMLDPGWRLSLPGPPCVMLHYVVRGEGWLSRADGTHIPIGPNWVIVIPAGAAHSLDTREQYSHELSIECTPTGPPVHYILAGDAGPVEMVVGCGTLNVRYGEALGLFDHLSELLVIDLSGIAEVPGLFKMLLEEQAHDAFSRSPMSLVNHVRLERAAKMLSAGHLSIEQIGQRVGFSSRSHFSQAFKKHAGISPADYRDSKLV